MTCKATLRDKGIKPIPKIPCCSQLKHWRRITMMSVTYKITAKVIALRLTPALDRVITPQHGFIKKRSIYDNILAAIVGIEYARCTKQECILLQIDLDKAYDRIEWKCIEEVMSVLGFGPRMCSIVRTLGEGSILELLFNNKIVGSFEVKRSIKQGYAMAPLLFALGSHPLVAALEASADKGEIQGLELPRGKRLLAKLFADDSLLFLKANFDILRKALQIIQLFATASGSKCNIEKSRLISLTEGDSFDPSSWSGEVISKGTIVRHLGVPIGVDVTDKQRLEWVMERIKKK